MSEPATSTWRKDIEVGVISHVGMVRSENQDHYAYYEPEEDEDLRAKGRLLVVCDGMGGHNGGTVASRTTVEAMLDSFRRSATHNLKRLLSTAIDKANASVRSKGMEDPSLRNMGTTCVAVAARGSQVQIAHIGDSRAYFVREQEIDQITRDHTYLNDLIDIGLLTPERARNHPERNIITRCVGMGDVVQVDYNTRQAKPGDCIVLCSDGLFNHVEDYEILEITTAMEAQAAAQALVDLANCRGGEDNITVGIMKVLSVPREFEETNAEHPIRESDIVEAEAQTPVLDLDEGQTPTMPYPRTPTPVAPSVSPGIGMKTWLAVLTVELVILFILEILIRQQ